MTFPKRIAIPSNWEPIVREVSHEFQAWVAYVIEADARAQTAFICDAIRLWLPLVSLAPRLPGSRMVVELSYAPALAPCTARHYVPHRLPISGRGESRGLQSAPGGHGGKKVTETSV